MSKPALYRFAYALIMLHGQMTNAFHLDFQREYTPKQNARNSVHLRIFLPEGSEEEFMKMTNMVLKPPPKIHLS